MTLASRTGYAAQRAEQAFHQAKPGLAWLARAGYAARGVLYLVIGLLAASAAAGFGGKTTDPKGALDEVAHQPLGPVLLGALCLGLLGYAVWRFLQAALDPEREAQRGAAIGKRALWFLAGLVNLGLAAYAFHALTGIGSEGGDDARSATAKLLAWTPLGPVIVAGVGIGFVIAAGVQGYHAFKAKLDEQLDLSGARPRTRRILVTISRFGIAARAVVFAVAGAFLLVAALTSDADRAKGFGESLRALRATPLGAPLFIAVSVGLIAFAAYQFVEARYRRLLGTRPPTLPRLT